MLDSELWHWLWVQEMIKRIAKSKSRLAWGQSQGGESRGGRGLLTRKGN